MIQPPEYIKQITPYVPGKPVEELERELGIEGAIKLASNENPLGPSPKTKEAISNVISALNRYPDGSGYYLKRRLSEMLGVREEELILGNGSNELIDIAVRTFMNPGDEAVMATPSFVVYPMSVRTVGGKAIQIPLKEWRHDLKAMADAITERTKIVFIANPNNPTGTINFADEFREFMKKTPESVLVVVDEAYFEYVENKGYPDTMNYFKKGRGILILRTFSKIYSLAALRIGYGVANKDIITELNKIREPFNTNTVAQAAALAALDDEEHIQKSLNLNKEGKAYLYKEFKRFNINFIPTEANFIFVKLSTPSASDIYNRLLKKGIIIRPMSDDSMRITIGLPEENRKLVEALDLVIGHH